MSYARSGDKGSNGQLLEPVKRGVIKITRNKSSQGNLRTAEFVCQFLIPGGGWTVVDDCTNFPPAKAQRRKPNNRNSSLCL
jgi:hypothetical protein